MITAGQLICVFTFFFYNNIPVSIGYIEIGSMTFRILKICNLIFLHISGLLTEITHTGVWNRVIIYLLIIKNKKSL